jgi:competence CoiA-like predicted nuclease
MKENDPEDKRSKIKKKYVTYFCPICFEPSHLKVHRNWLLKYLLFFLPVRKYFCDGCKKPFYVNIKTGKRSSHLH